MVHTVRTYRRSLAHTAVHIHSSFVTAIKIGENLPRLVKINHGHGQNKANILSTWKIMS